MGRRVRGRLEARQGADQPSPRRSFAGTLALAAMAPVILATVGCTEPQSGVVAQDWCKPSGTGDEWVDDMEDGDGVLCDRTGAWSIEGHDATTMPPTGALAAAPFLDAPVTAGKVSLRGLSITGTGFDDRTGNKRPWAALVARFGATVDLNRFETIRFRVRTTRQQMQLRLGVITGGTSEAATAMACDDSYPDHWGRSTIVTASSGDLWSVVDIAVSSLQQQGCSAASNRVDRVADVGDSLGLELRYAPFFLDPGDANLAQNTFDLWVDDVELLTFQ